MFRANVEDFGEKCSLKDIEWIMKIQKKIALNQLLLHLRFAKGIVSHYFVKIIFKYLNFAAVLTRL